MRLAVKLIDLLCVVNFNECSMILLLGEPSNYPFSLSGSSSRARDDLSRAKGAAVTPTVAADTFYLQVSAQRQLLQASSRPLPISRLDQLK